MNKSNFRYVDDPTAIALENGEIGVGWVEQSHKNIVFQRIRPDGEPRFDEPTNVSRSPNTFSWLPDIHMQPHPVNTDTMQVYMLWQEIVFSGGTHGGEIFFSRSADGGRTFSDPLNLSNSIAGDGKGRLTKKFWHNGSLDLSVGPDNRLYAAWTEYEGKLWLSRSTDHGKSFSDPLHIAGSYEKPARGPSLTIDPDGILYLVWTYGEHPRTNVYISKSTNHGRSFTEPVIAVKNKGHTDAPEIVADNNRTLHLAYGVSPTGPFKKYEIRYSRSSDSAGSFNKPRTLPNPLGTTFNMGHFPSIAHTSENHLFLIWELFRNPGTRPVSLAFTYSTNGGETFASPIVLPGSNDTATGVNGSQQGYLLDKLSVNRHGEIAVANSTFRRGRSSHVWLYRGYPTP